jgi:hypothetical protein
LRGIFPSETDKCFAVVVHPDTSTVELRAELAAQIDREREIRDQIEKQLNEEQKIRCKSLTWNSDTK